MAVHTRNVSGQIESRNCSATTDDSNHGVNYEALIRNALPGRETPYGFLKRIRFFENVIHERKPKTILDVGCGMGSLITFPLAERFPEVQFTASDEDEDSIRAAQAMNDLANLDFVFEGEIRQCQQEFDLIIASEVLEHVFEPIEFLRSLRQKLSDDGVLILTVPNGYGPFEWAALCYALADISGAYDFVSRLGYRRRDVAVETARMCDTLASSPHVNFFNYSDLRETLRKSGLSIVQYRPRTFFCGWLIDKLVSHGRGPSWNARFADFLPAAFCSGWMFVLSKIDAQVCQRRKYVRTRWARFRRRLNEVVYGVKHREPNADPKSCCR